ncbi:MAG: hypothetical protein JJD98_01780 [Polaromonas sp.]|nr:hypothetical protein [Polaromonas sp.]
MTLLRANTGPADTVATNPEATTNQFLRVSFILIFLLDVSFTVLAQLTVRLVRARIAHQKPKSRPAEIPVGLYSSSQKQKQPWLRCLNSGAGLALTINGNGPAWL